ncbi:MAG: hypothetical protein VXY82_11695, partial [Planctomycetota bacterium]|nr:hypothetical protein [Planctomycetota bacterium]
LNPMSWVYPTDPFSDAVGLSHTCQVYPISNFFRKYRKQPSIPRMHILQGGFSTEVKAEYPWDCPSS